MYNIKISLPSRGKYGATYVKIRRPKLMDILDYLQSGDNSVISKNVFVEKLCDTNIKSYPIGDREFIFANIRSLVGDSILSGTFPCEKEGCKDTIVYILDLKKCKVNQLPEDFISNYEVEFPFSKEKKILNLLTVEKEELLESYISYYETAETELIHSSIGDNLYELARYACMFSDSVTIKDIDDNITFLTEKLTWDDFLQVMMAYDIGFQCGPELVVTSKCDTCGALYNIQIKTDSSFFGLSIEGLIRKHKFLAKANIGFKDFLEYSVPLMNKAVEDEVERIKEHNESVRRQTSKTRKKR